MYIDRIQLQRFRTFRSSEIAFVHPDQAYANGPKTRAKPPAAPSVPLPFARPKLPNINLLLGNNGLGKTTLLKAIALTALGPAVASSGIYPYRLIRREPKATDKRNRMAVDEAVIAADFTPHEQDGTGSIRHVESRVTVKRKGDLEVLEWSHSDEKPWFPIYRSQSDAFFIVGYGATRRVEKRERVDFGGRKSSAFDRAQRVQSLFEEAYSLIPLNAWLPQYRARNKGRYIQVVGLINRLLGGGNYSFKGELEAGEYVFEREGLKVPFPALSDGYRAFLGWVSDLLYYVCTTCPSGKKLVDNKGIVMVDEIDLHLHPKWQMTVLPRLAGELPNIQFIVTSHSPLVVGSLEWMNIVVMRPEHSQASVAERIEWPIHGLDADQVLLTDFFGLESTRAPGKKRRLKELTLAARAGSAKAARDLLEEMSRGAEAAE